MNDFKQGTCQDMCPMSEIKHRTREEIVHFYEKHYGVFVKEFTRSAAGQCTQKPSELRTKEALMDTVVYLLTQIFHDQQRSYKFKYEFIFDRLRSIRQELVIQNFDHAFTIEILEPTCMFLAFSLYELSHDPEYDLKICSQHLQECLKKVLVCYDETQHISLNRCTLETVYLLFNLGNSKVIERAVKLPEAIRQNSCVGIAFQMNLNHWQGNFCKVIKLMTTLPDLLCAIASIRLGEIRWEMLHIFATAYNNKQLSVPLDWLQEILIYSDECELEKDLLFCNLPVLSVDNKKRVKFEKTSFDTAKTSLPMRRHSFVIEKLKCKNFSKYFLLDPQ